VSRGETYLETLQLCIALSKK